MYISIDNAWNKQFYFTSFLIESDPKLFCVYGPKIIKIQNKLDLL